MKKIRVMIPEDLAFKLPIAGRRIWFENAILEFLDQLESLEAWKGLNGKTKYEIVYVTNELYDFLKEKIGFRQLSRFLREVMEWKLKKLSRESNGTSKRKLEELFLKQVRLLKVK